LRTPDEARFSLPPQRTALFGCDGEVQGLVAKLRVTPLVTVTGPGGVGKTTLAVQAAGEALSGFPGGAWFVSLATVESGEAVGDVVLTAVGARRQAGRSALATLRELAHAHRLLVVLDNCEHVVDAAADCAEGS
jgi:predicted ATPase